jgi:hypothetical protein
MKLLILRGRVIGWGWHFSGLCNNRGGMILRWLGQRHVDLGQLDGTLLELVGELLVQEIAYDQDGNESHNVKNVKEGTRLDFAEDGTLGMIYDWGAHY